MDNSIKKSFFATSALLQSRKELKPTATVVRDRKGRIHIEREELFISKEERDKSVQASLDAMKKHQIRDNLLNAKRFPVTSVRSKRFDLDTETAAFLEHLDTHGYAVVASVASSTEVEKAKDLAWKFLEGNNRLKPYHTRRGDPSTWEMDWLGNPETGIINGYGVGQAQFMWYLRLLPAISKAFGAIWDTNENELLCSFDGANVFRPWKYKPEWKTKGGWYHLDQNAYNPGKSGRCCVQGLVTLEKADENSGGLVVIPGSHRKFLGLCERYAEKPRDKRRGREKNQNINLMNYVRVKEDDEVVLGGGYLICAEAGDLIVWDSRTVHCNSPALINSKNNGSSENWELLRIAAYICMTPASWSNDEVLKKRWDAYINNVSTDHWPHIFGGRNAAPYDMGKNDPRSICERQRLLIGAWMDPPLNVINERYTETQLEARRLLELAEKAESNNDCIGAIRLYRRAYKLDPSLEFPPDD